MSIIGKKYGLLTVISEDKSKQAKCKYFLCRCDCGKEISVSRTNLYKGGQNSCGCTRKGKNIKDITGYKFGELTAIECVKENRGTAIWKCLCSCGNFCEVRQGNLNSGHTTSCGCKKSEIWVDATARVAGVKSSEKTGRFETNIHSKEWLLTSPEGDVYKVKNLVNFIRENCKLFGISQIDIEINRKAKLMSEAAKKGHKCGGWTVTKLGDKK